MAKIDFNGQPFRPTVVPLPETLESRLYKAIRDEGIDPPDDFVFDGEVHRFAHGGKKTEKPGWYVMHQSEVGDFVGGAFGCWKLGIRKTFSARLGGETTQADSMRMAQLRAEMDAKIEAAKKELEDRRARAANTVQIIWSEAVEASPEHPYLAAKRIKPHGARVSGEGRLILPAYNQDGELVTIQYIDAAGSKQLQTGGEAGGASWWIGSVSDPKLIYICEGFATAASIYEATGDAVFIAFSAHNLPVIANQVRERYGKAAQVVIVADNDESGTGEKYAKLAADRIGASYVMPPEIGTDANDYANDGGDLGKLLQPIIDEHWLEPFGNFCEQPAPIGWLLKGWLQKEALIMVHGPSGSGKTFVVLDWCLHIASGFSDWHGKTIHNGPVIYLAGEGHHGLRGRGAAWRQANNASISNMWISKSGCDLNSAAGYAKAVAAINQIDAKPSLVVVDTLHRFLDGDENSAQDTKTMLDACNALMHEFGCSVLLVHHTGVDKEAQHRARGSSAWRGALDIEISIKPAKNPGEPMRISQQKSKDAELAPDLWVRLESVPIDGWIDEDGEPVTSAVVRWAEKPDGEGDDKTSKPLAEAKKTIVGAWADGDMELHDGLPVVFRDPLYHYIKATRLKSGRPISDATLRGHTSNGSKGKMINLLIAEGLVLPIEDSKKGGGWQINGSELLTRINLECGTKFGNGNI